MKLLRSIFKSAKAKKTRSIDSFPKLKNAQKVKGGLRRFQRTRFDGPVIIVEDTHFRPKHSGH